MRIVFMGSPEISVPTLRALAGKYKVAGVVTQPDREAGRGNKIVMPPVKIAAADLKIPLIQPERLKEPEAFERLKAWKPDVIVVLAYGQILKKNVLELPKLGCINVHASLLPRWRGASPIQAAILHGDKFTGVTIMKMDPGIDTGPWLNMRKIKISEKDTAGTLSEKLARLGADLLIETLPGYLDGQSKPQPQNEMAASYTSLISKKDGLLDFSRSAEELVRCVRAYNPWPSAYFMMDDKPVKIYRAHVEQNIFHFSPGKRVVYEGHPAIVTGNGLLQLDEMQAAGKKLMSGNDFLSGCRNWTL